MLNRTVLLPRDPLYVIHSHTETATPQYYITNKREAESVIKLSMFSL